MTDAPLVLMETDGAIALLTLNRPAAGNSLSVTMIDQFHQILLALGDRKDIKVIILSGSGAPHRQRRQNRDYSGAQPASAAHLRNRAGSAIAARRTDPIK